MTTIPTPFGVEEQGSVTLGAIVVVEDHLVSNLVRAVLQRHGYHVRLAEAADATSLLQAGNSEARLLITNSPGSFLDFAAQVPLVYLTSQPDVLLQTAFRNCRVVVKPFIPEDLVQAVGALIGPS